MELRADHHLRKPFLLVETNDFANILFGEPSRLLSAIPERYPGIQGGSYNRSASHSVLFLQLRQWHPRSIIRCRCRSRLAVKFLLALLDFEAVAVRQFNAGGVQQPIRGTVRNVHPPRNGVAALQLLVKLPCEVNSGLSIWLACHFSGSPSTGIIP